MDFIASLLQEKGPELVSLVSSKAGLSQDQAERFVPEAAQATVSQLKSGEGLDLAGLLGGQGIESLLGKLDVSALASGAGIGQEQAGTALQSFLPALLGMLGEQGGGLQGVMSALGGGDAKGLLGGASKLAGKLFGR